MSLLRRIQNLGKLGEQEFIEITTGGDSGTRCVRALFVAHSGRGFVV